MAGPAKHRDIVADGWCCCTGADDAQRVFDLSAGNDTGVGGSAAASEHVVRKVVDPRTKQEEYTSSRALASMFLDRSSQYVVASL